MVRRSSMTASRFNRYWTLITAFLVAIIAVGGIVTGVRYSGGEPIEISTPSAQELQGDIYIGGAVNNPGFYPLKVGDTIEALIQAAGGAGSSADLSWLKLYIPEAGAEEEPQKVNLNRAEVWLLEALPGIGETLAQRIVDYRNQNGLFRNINQLINVEGIGTATFDQIEHLITVAD
jgi:competence protein ComEA